MKKTSKPVTSKDTPQEALERYFNPGGVLAQTLDGYESRPQQIDMAVAVARAIRRSGRVVVEAGTGTGKTLSYLIPAAISEKKEFTYQ